MALTPQQEIAILDVGTTKLSCLIAHIGDDGQLIIDGSGHHVSAGIKAGTIVDMVVAEQAIRQVVHKAEAMAERTIEDIIVVTTAGETASTILSVEVSVAGHAVEAADINRVLRLARRQMMEEPRAVLHAFPACYSVDAAHGVRAPEGMFGERLGVDFHMVTAEAGPLQNLENCIARCHLNVLDMVVAPYASGLSCLHEEEKELGVACIDMGGGCTSISLFFGGVMVNSAVLPIGGDAITRDIAKMLSTSMSEAERMKTLHGTVFEYSTDHGEFLDVVQLVQNGPDGHNGGRIRKSQLTGIIRPRVEEILEAVAETLHHAGFLGRDTGSIVLTGGASRLQGMVALTEHMLGANARFGFPQQIKGLAEMTSGPGFAACVGAALHMTRDDELIDYAQDGLLNRPQNGPWPQRVVQWLKEAL